MSDGDALARLAAGQQALVRVFEAVPEEGEATLAEIIATTGLEAGLVIDVLDYIEGKGLTSERRDGVRRWRRSANG